MISSNLLISLLSQPLWWHKLALVLRGQHGKRSQKHSTATAKVRYWQQKKATSENQPPSNNTDNFLQSIYPRENTLIATELKKNSN